MVDDMALSDAERSRRYRNRKRGGPPQLRKLKPHGTPAAYRRHVKAGEAPCEPCRQAESERQKRLYRDRRGEM